MSIRKLLGLPPSNEKLTAEMANRKSRYGTMNPFEEIVKDKVEEIERLITNKLDYSPQEKLLALIVPQTQKPLFDSVMTEFISRGFKAFYVSKEQIVDLGENIYLFISWDLDITNSEE